MNWDDSFFGCFSDGGYLQWVIRFDAEGWNVCAWNRAQHYWQRVTSFDTFNKAKQFAEAKDCEYGKRLPELFDMLLSINSD
jgi:hypothetical protein